MIYAQNGTETAKSGKPNIKILATGGTIAGRGSSSTQTRGYTPGIIGIQMLNTSQRIVNAFQLYKGIMGKTSLNDLEKGWHSPHLVTKDILSRKYLI